MRPLRVLALALSVCAGACTKEDATSKQALTAKPRLTNVGPRVLSNATAYPVMLYGEHLMRGAVLRVKSTPPRDLPTYFVDEGHLTAEIPSGTPLPEPISSARVQLTLLDTHGATIAGDASVTMVNDLAFATPYAILPVDGPEVAWVVDRNADTLRAAATGAILKVGDRPRAIRSYRGGWVVAEEPGSLTIGGHTTVSQLDHPISLPSDAADLSVDEAKGLAYVSILRDDRIQVVELATGNVLRTLPAGVNPRASALAEAGTRLVVANYQSQDVSVIDLETGTETRLRPGPGTPIIGGRTEKYSAFIMGSTPPRAVVASDKLHVAFVATMGPNIGPNPDRMEVTQNGGVSVIDTKSPKWLRHVSIGNGVAHALALDDARGLLYVADTSTGRVVVLDAKKLTTDSDAKKALLAALLLPVPEGVALVRPEADFGVEGRATTALHFGPIALGLFKDNQKLAVLSRSSGAVAVVDVKARGKLLLEKVWPGPPPSLEADRRKGETLYYSDLGNSGMTCDTCHPDGHVGGVMFTKGRPIRIYRGHTIRSIRESAPYFTPTRLPSIKRTMTDVLARNRFHNPDPTADEVSWGTEYVGTIPGPPNPYYGKGGELPAMITLPDGKQGAPAKGLALYEGKAGCGSNECHPAPHFTADQAQDTRGRLDRLGTPMALQLRPELQDLGKDFGQPPPSLMGVWDEFPLFLSGAGGNEVTAEGTIVAAQPFALRWVLENPAWKPHGSKTVLTPEELDDLLAYLLTL